MSNLNKLLREWWTEVLLDWAFQTAPKDTVNGKKARDMIAAYESLKD
jgi:hypothetical protein